MKVAISAESSIDLPKELLEKYKIFTTPFTILLGDDIVLDGEISTEDIFNHVEKTKILPKTSAVNEHQFTEHFEKLLKDNDAVIHFSMSSLMSCAYQNAVSASKKINNVYIVDTKSLSGGIAILAIKAKEMVDKNKSVQQILEQIKNYIPKVQVSLIVDKLDYLRKGGRCSGLLCFGANLLKIHPQIILKNGKLTLEKKYRGNYEKCIMQYSEDILMQYDNYDKSIAFVAYTSLEKQTLEKLTDLLKKFGFKEVIPLQTGATISSHAGPNAMGILYLCN